jgi:hypothetical protein
LPGGTDAHSVAEAMLVLMPTLAPGAAAASPDARARAVDAIADAIAPYATPDGYRVKGSTWIVTAVNPG